MARPSPLPTARPNPFLVARRIVQRQASSATCGWISGDLSLPVLCPEDQSCLYDTTSLFVANCCDALAGCSTLTTACLDSSSASSQCGQESCGPSTLQCTNSDFPLCQTLYYPFSNTLSSFACVSSLTSGFTAYDVYTTTTSEGDFPNVQPGLRTSSGAAASSTTTSPFRSPTGSAGASSSTPTSSRTPTSQSSTSSPPISTSTNPTSQPPTSTSTALSSSTPHPLPTSVSPFPTSTFDSIKGIAGASLFFLIVISFLLTLILFAIGLLIMLFTRRREPRPDSTTGSDDYSPEEDSRPPTSHTLNGSTASTLPVSGPGPDPPSPPPSTHTSPPPGPYTDSSSSSTSVPSSTSNTIRQPTPAPSSAPSSHSSGPALPPGPLLQNPLLPAPPPPQDRELTSHSSTGMLSDGSGPQDVPPPGLVSLANLRLGARSKPLPEEPGGLLDGNSRSQSLPGTVRRLD